MGRLRKLPDTVLIVLENDEFILNDERVIDEYITNEGKQIRLRHRLKAELIVKFSDILHRKEVINFLCHTFSDVNSYSGSPISD